MDAWMHQSAGDVHPVNNGLGLLFNISTPENIGMAIKALTLVGMAIKARPSLVHCSDLAGLPPIIANLANLKAKPNYLV